MALATINRWYYCKIVQTTAVANRRPITHTFRVDIGAVGWLYDLVISTFD